MGCILLMFAVVLGGSASSDDSPGFIGITINFEEKEAVVIDRVYKGLPGDKAGLKTGDVITKLDGKPYTSAFDFILAMRAKMPGDEVTLTVRRDKSVTVH